MSRNVAEIVPYWDSSAAPQYLRSTCHDGSAFLNCKCVRCGNVMHVHESSLAYAPPEFEILAPCLQCGEMVIFPAYFFSDNLEKLRREGWIV